MSSDGRSAYRWYLLGLAAATHTFAAAMPLSCMPVLFGEISEDLGLSLVEIGAVWGVVSLAGVFVALLAGLLGDRFGIKLVLGSACILGGLTGGMRGLSGDFASVAATVFMFGLIRSTIPVNVHKTVSIWFRGRNLGMANGVVAMGMGIGLMLGPLISATILSPLLGGWRNVLILYGAVSFAIGLLWLISGREHRNLDLASSPSGTIPMRQSISKLVRIKDLWLLGLTLMFRSGCIHGLTGYVPLYLRQQGWALASADGALAVFYIVSTTAVIPLSLLSDRLVSRKVILIPALLTSAVGLSLLPLADGILVWVLVILVGIFMDSFMAIILSMVQETVGVGPRYSGTALGLVFTMAMSGAFLSPPLGNSLAGVGPGLPFVFWAALSVVAVVILFFAKETAQRR